MSNYESHCRNLNDCRQRCRARMMRYSTRTLLTLTVAALFTVTSISAFHILQTPSRAPTTVIRHERIEHDANRREQRLSAVVAATAPKRSRATMVLKVSSDENDDNKAPRFGRRLQNLKQRIQSRKTKTIQNLKKRNRHRRAAKVVALSLASAGSIAGIMSGAPAPAFARNRQDMIDSGDIIYSLRPGVTKEQAEQLTSGVMPDEVRDKIDSKTSVGAISGYSKEETIEKAKQKKSIYGDYDDYDDDDFIADEQEFGDSSYGNSVEPPSKQRQKAFSSEEGDGSSEISMSTKSVFSGISEDTTKTKPSSLYLKVSLSMGVPTFGFFGVRDYVRNRKEEENIKRAIEIVDEQRAEYFGIDKDGKNITATDEDDETDDDEDDDDELDDGDEDDDIDEDDEDDEPPRRRRSPLPKGPQGDGSGGAGGPGSDDSGYDRPSDDDIERMQNLFNNS